MVVVVVVAVVVVVIFVDSEVVAGRCDVGGGGGDGDSGRGGIVQFCGGQDYGHRSSGHGVNLMLSCLPGASADQMWPMRCLSSVPCYGQSAPDQRQRRTPNARSTLPNLATRRHKPELNLTLSMSVGTV